MLGDLHTRSEILHNDDVNKMLRYVNLGMNAGLLQQIGV